MRRESGTPSWRRVRGLLALGVALAVTACNPHTVREDPPPPVEVPTTFRRAGGPAAYDGGQWWQAFGDARLSAAVERALADNFDIAAAWARLDQTEAMARRAGAAWWPRVTAGVDVSRTRSVLFAGGPLGTLERESNDFGLSLAASYEADLWGKVAATEDAALLDARATREELSAAAMTVAAQVTDTWFALAEQVAQEELIQRQLEVGRTFLELVELRFGQGFASALDVYQQRLQVAGTEAQLPPVRAQREVLENQLAVLLGRPPSDVTAADGGVPTPTALPAAPPLPGPGVPADVLAGRPDVRAAKLRLVASDHRIAAATAEWLPGLQLSASTGFRAQDITKLFEGWIWTLAASLTQLIWDGGARSAEIDRAEAALRELVANYGRVVLNALREVDDALAREARQRESIEQIEGQLAIARDELAEARARYVGGLSDYLPVLTALSALQRLERQQVTARRQLLAFRVQLHRALGGTWTDELGRDRSASDRTDTAGPADDDPERGTGGAAPDAAREDRP